MRNMLLLVLLLFMPFWCGCVKYSYETYQVKIIDAEENIPIEGADVSIGYMSKRLFPPLSRAVTNQRGLAELQVADGIYWFVNVSAEGYIPFNHTSFMNYYLHRQDLIFQNNNELTVLICKKPEPIIEIIVPDGYRGPVILKEYIVDMSPAEVGKRFFSYKMQSNGIFSVKVLPLFYGMDIGSIIKARYENGNVAPIINFTGPSVFDRDAPRKLFIGSRNDYSEWIQKRAKQINGNQ
jgi:hypothetical protein